MSFEITAKQKQSLQLKDLKELLKKLENSSASLDDFKRLDENDSEMSDVEKGLHEKLGNTKSLIEFIKGLIECLEKEKIKLKIKANGHDVYIKRNGNSFLLMVDDYGFDSYKVFNKYPTESEIQESIKEYEKGGEKAKKDGWKEEIYSKALEVGADAIESVNDNFYDEKDILENLRDYISKIKQVNVKKYITDEIKRLENGGKKTKWTELLHTIVTKYSTEWITKPLSAVHNTAQDRIIEEILGGKGKSYGEYNGEIYIQGYNNDISNYLIKVKDFESYLISSETKIDGVESGAENPNQVNSKALASYLSYLFDSNEGGNIYTIFKKIREKIGKTKLSSLAKIWRETENTVAQKILREKGYGNIIDIIKKPEKIIESNSSDIINTALEVGDGNFIESLEKFVRDNKDNPEFKDKLQNFYSKVSSDSCPDSIKKKIEKIISLLQNGNSVTEAVTEGNKTVNNKKLENKILIILGLWFQPKVSTTNSSKQSLDIGTNKNMSQSNISSSQSSDMSKVNGKLSYEEIEAEISKLDRSKIKKILSIFNEEKQCSNIFGVNAEKIYRKLNERLIEIEREKMNTKLTDLLKLKWNEKYGVKIDEDKLNTLKLEIIKVIEVSTCITDIFLLINNIFKREKLDIKFDDKDIITQILGHSIEARRAKKANEINEITGTMGNTIQNPEDFQEDPIVKKALEDLNRLKFMQENNEILSKSNEEEFNDVLIALKEGKNPKEVMKGLRKEYKKRKIREVDSTNNSKYQLDGSPQKKAENNYNINVNGQEISGLTEEEVSNIGEVTKEGEFIINNPEALKNLVDFKEKMEILNLTNSVWLNRKFFIEQFRILKGISGIDISDNDYMNKAELNKLLNFILEIIGEEGSKDNIASTYSTIIDINGGGMFNDKKDTNTNFSNIGYRLYKKGCINKSGGTVTDRNKNAIQNKENCHK